MKDFAFEEKQSWIKQEDYWNRVEKKIRLKSDIGTVIAEIGMVAIMIVLSLFLLVQ